VPHDFLGQLQVLDLGVQLYVVFEHVCFNSHEDVFVGVAATLTRGGCRVRPLDVIFSRARLASELVACEGFLDLGFGQYFWFLFLLALFQRLDGCDDLPGCEWVR